MLKLSFLLFPSPLLASLSPVVLAESMAKTCARPDENALSYRGDGPEHSYRYINKLTVSDLYEALITCSNITSLDGDFTMTGCVEHGYPWSFDFQEGDRFPALL